MVVVGSLLGQVFFLDISPSSFCAVLVVGSLLRTTSHTTCSAWLGMAILTRFGLAMEGVVHGGTWETQIEIDKDTN